MAAFLESVFEATPMEELFPHLGMEIFLCGGRDQDQDQHVRYSFRPASHGEEFKVVFNARRTKLRGVFAGGNTVH